MDYMRVILTEEIKECILENRIWHAPSMGDAKPNITLNHTINNYNQISSYPAKDLICMIDELTRFDDITTLNVVHDTVSDRINMFDSGKWVSLLFDIGVDEMISKLKDIYFDYYETYLLFDGTS